MKVSQLILVLALIIFQIHKAYASTGKSIQSYEQIMNAEETELSLEALADEEADEALDLKIDAALDTEPDFENKQGADTIESNLQTAAINKVKDSGKWAFEFIYIDENGNENILSQYNVHQILKPASTQKLFSGHLAFLEQSYPINNLAAMLHVSHNQMADSALMSVAKNRGFTKNLLANGVQILKSTYFELQDSDKYIPIDGSGLSYANKVTPRLEIDLLRRIYNDAGYSQFKKMLAHPSDQKCSYDTKQNQIGSKHKYHSTVGSRLNSLAGRLHAKTGTLKRTKALAGFVDGKNGKGVLIFSVIGDYLKTSTPIAFSKIQSLVSAHIKFVDENL